MPKGLKRFVLLAILFFVIHFGLTGYYALAWTEMKDSAPYDARFVHAFRVAACTFPLFSIVKLRITFFGMAVANSALIAIALALMVVYLPWRVTIGIVIAVPLVVIAGMYVAAMTIERRVERGWRGVDAKAYAVVDRDNADAQRVKNAVHALEGYPATLAPWLRRQFDRADDFVEPMPQTLDHYFVVHRADIDALERELLTGKTLQWSSWMGHPPSIYVAEKVLLADALMKHSRDGIDAANRLSSSLVEQPAVDAMFTSIAAVENQLGASRKLDPPPQFPVRRYDVHRAVMNSLITDATWLATIKVPWYARPYTRLAVAESASNDLDQARLLQKSRGCGFAEPPVPKEQTWVPFNPIGVSEDAPRIAARANRLQLDFEGTEKMLAAKRGAAVAGPSTVCRDHMWLTNGSELSLEPPIATKPPALPAHHSWRTQ